VNSKRILELLNRRAALIAVVLVLIGTLRIAATWTVFNHTADEPAHISCGLEWLSKGVYRYEHQHPPLTRVLAALGPFLAGERTTGHPDMNTDGLVILHKSNRYDTLLALSRAGNLLFFWLAAAMAYLWGLRISGKAGAVLSVLVFTCLPLVLAHAGLSTTDMGLTAMFAGALYALLRCVEAPSWRTGVAFGLALGGMVLTKFSGLAYFPAAVAVMVAVWLWRERVGLQGLARGVRSCWLQVSISAPVAFLTIWAGYRFSFGASGWFPFPVPFPELFSGIDQVSGHNKVGHLSYLLGDLSLKGWWLFFPTLIAVKTPIAVLLAMAAPLLLPKPAGAKENDTRWPSWLPLTIVMGILLVAMGANINIGLRHVLPAFPFVAVAAAVGLVALLQGARVRIWSTPAFWTLVLWLAATGVLAHPDYLPYFNAFAGDHPENIVVDSDLDWGQDMKRLGRRMVELNAPHVTFTNHVPANLSAFGFPPRQHSDPFQPAPGWNAVSLTEWKLYRMGLQLDQKGVKTWPDVAVPVERVGQSILLFRFAEPSPSPGNPVR
jgi:hypothetical protein